MGWRGTGSSARSRSWPWPGRWSPCASCSSRHPGGPPQTCCPHPQMSRCLCTRRPSGPSAWQPGTLSRSPGRWCGWACPPWALRLCWTPTRACCWPRARSGCWPASSSTASGRGPPGPASCCGRTALRASSPASCPTASCSSSMTSSCKGWRRSSVPSGPTEPLAGEQGTEDTHSPQKPAVRLLPALLPLCCAARTSRRDKRQWRGWRRVWTVRLGLHSTLAVSTPVRASLRLPHWASPAPLGPPP